MSAEIPITEAAQRLGIPLGKLLGHALRDEPDDPLIVDRLGTGEYLVADDWRLKRLARSGSTPSRE